MAILAGFYTSKIISIAGDKNRIQNKINQLNLEIKRSSELVDNYEQDLVQEELVEEDSMIDLFVNHLESPDIYMTTEVLSSDDITRLYKEYWEIENQAELTDSVLKKLEDKSASIIQENKDLREKANAESNIHRFMDAATKASVRRVKLFRPEEDDEKLRTLRDNLEKEKNHSDFLREHLSLNRVELTSTIYPKRLKFGFFSFIIFAWLGVIFPLTSQWWQQHINGFLNLSSDLLAIIAFGIGLAVTFAYIGMETVSVLKKGIDEDNRKLPSK